MNWFLKFNKRAKIIYCVIDEGVATYMPTSEPYLKVFSVKKNYFSALLFHVHILYSK